LAQAKDADVQKSLPAVFLQIAAAATLSAADHGVQSKEQATRRSRTLPNEAHMFADGFVVGLSFALQVSYPPYITQVRQHWQCGHAACWLMRHNIAILTDQSNCCNTKRRG